MPPHTLPARASMPFRSAGAKLASSGPTTGTMLRPPVTMPCQPALDGLHEAAHAAQKAALLVALPGELVEESRRATPGPCSWRCSSTVPATRSGRC